MNIHEQTLDRNSLRDLKHHPPSLDLHAFYRLHLKSLLVVILLISSHQKLAMNIITIVQAS